MEYAQRLAIGIDHSAITKPPLERFRIRLVDLAGGCVVADVWIAAVEVAIVADGGFDLLWVEGNYFTATHIDYAIEPTPNQFFACIFLTLP